MRLSRFAPLGLLRLTSKPPVAKAIFHSMNAELGEQFSVAEGTYYYTKHFATALAIARVKRRLQQAASQGLPRHVTRMLPVKELEKGIIPGPNDTLAERRRVLAAYTLIADGGAQTDIEQALRLLLGDDFIAYRTCLLEEVVPLVEAGAYAFKAPSTQRKVIQLQSSVIAPTQTVPYSVVSSTIDPIAGGVIDLVEGETVMLAPGRLGCTEVVTVDGVLDAPKRFTATFTKTHDNGTIGITHPAPVDATTKRHSLVVVTPECASNPEKRRKVNAILPLIVRSVSTWDIVAADGDSVQQFQIDTPSIGIAMASPVSIET